MITLPDQIKNSVDQINNLDNLGKLDKAAQVELLDNLYNKHNLSWTEIANLFNTHKNTIRRYGLRLGLKSKSRSESQKLALQTNKRAHPTKGKLHTEKTKNIISNKLAKNWDAKTPEEKSAFNKAAKERFEARSEEDKKKFHELGNKAILDAAKNGSKLEKFLLGALIDAKYKVQFHKEHFLLNERLQIDLFLPEYNIAIEVDGPWHFKDIYEDGKTYQKTQLRDSTKSGLLLASGYVIIRIRQKRKLNKNFCLKVKNALLKKIREISKEFPKETERSIVIG